LKNVRISFPVLAEPERFGDGDPAYQAKFIIDPKSENAKILDAAILAAAKDKWESKAEAVLKSFGNDNKKICYVKEPYRSSKTGEVYGGFEGNYCLSARNTKNQPTIVDRFGKQVTSGAQIKSLIYSGCYVHATLDIWAQDNTFGRGLRATLTGVMFAKDGEAFGGSAPAAADDFADLAQPEEEALA
jgi:hypothetical protein